MTHSPWFKNTSKIDYTGYRDLLSLTRYVHASRAYYSTLSAVDSPNETDAREAMLYTHQAMIKAKSFLIHYKPESSLIRQLVLIEWQYLLKSNQLWMPRVSLIEPLSEAAKEKMDRLSWRYLRKRNLALKGDDLDSNIEKILMCLLMRDRSSPEYKRTSIPIASISRKSLICARKNIDIDFNDMVEQCEIVASNLLLTPQRAWDYKQSLVASNDRLLGLFRHLIGLIESTADSALSETEVEVSVEKINHLKLDLINEQYFSSKNQLLFHFPEIICTNEKRGYI